MLTNEIVTEAKKLIEKDSIALFEQIQFTKINTPLSSKEIATSYIKKGEGKTPVLLLHGFDSSVFEYRRLLPFLKKEYEVWALDLLGFGFTQRQANLNYSPHSIRTHLYHFWSTMINKPMILVGASMGGASAIDFCLSYPQAVEKLVLLDSGGLTKQPIIGKFLFPPLGDLATEFLRNLKVRQSISKTAYFNPEFASEDALRCAALHLQCENWSKALISFTKSGGYGSFAEELGQIRAETLILWGKNDKILGIKPASQFQELIPQSKLVWIDNCGHVPHLEKSEITAHHILDFVNS
ncbi:MAG: alpha/beta fold hydrolase [Geminocystis sp.]